MPRITRDTSSGKFVDKSQAKKRPATTVQERVVRLTPKNIQRIIELCNFDLGFWPERKVREIIAAYRKL